MKTAFAPASPIPAGSTLPAVRERFAPSRGHWVDALVSTATMAWLVAALAGMIGESNVIPSARATLPQSTEVPTALRTTGDAGIGVHEKAVDLNVPGALRDHSIRPGQSLQEHERH